MASKQLKYEQRKKAERERKLNKRRKEADSVLSEKFQKDFAKEIKAFDKRFSNIDSCANQLWKWKGWISDDGHKKFKCPDCKSRISYSYKKKNKGSFIDIYECKNLKCKKQVSLTSDTLFKGTKQPLYFWFVAIHAMLLLDDKAPLKYIRDKSQKFSDGKKLGLSVSKRNIELIVKKVRKELFLKKRYKKYRTLVGLHRADNFLKWYSSNSHDDLLVGFRTEKHPRTNFQATKYAKENNVDNVQRVFFIKSIDQINKGNWLLTFDMRKKGVENIRWLFVDTIKTMKEFGDKYEFQLIQLEKNKNYYRRPFQITNEFKLAFQGAIEEIGIESLSSSLKKNIVNLSKELLDNIATRMKYLTSKK